MPCPAGSYNPVPGLATVDQCVPCPVGHYCVGGDSKPTGKCSKGNFCPINQSTPSFGNEYEFKEATGGKCPPGHYCLEGALVPDPCPQGTYSDDVGNPIDGIDTSGGNIDQNGCRKCPAGFYCDEVGMTSTMIYARNKICDAGYHCERGAVVPHPTDGITGYLCRPGHYCLPGT